MPDGPAKPNGPITTRISMPGRSTKPKSCARCVDDNRFDREHVAEEIEDLGKSDRHAAKARSAGFSSIAEARIFAGRPGRATAG